MSDILIRPYDNERDAEAAARLLSWWYDATIQGEDFARRVRAWPDSCPASRYVAEKEGGVVGYGRSARLSENPKDAFMVDMIVDPEHHGEGIGTALLAPNEAYAISHGARHAVSMVNERQPYALTAAQSWGYQEKTKFFQNAMNPQEFEADLFRDYVESAEAAGFEITTLAELGCSDQAKRAFWDSMDAADRDTPTIEYFGFMSYEDFNSIEFEAEWFDPAGYFVVRYGDLVVATSSLQKYSKDFNGEMYVGFTGVRPEFRGRGLAMAIKTQTLEFAKQQGGTKLTTGINTDNDAMRAINRKLGFEEVEFQSFVVKRFEEELQ